MALENNFFYMIVDWYNQILVIFTLMIYTDYPMYKKAQQELGYLAQEASVLEN
jgi:ABC-type lipopolysaccharide export system ATPase subunit